MNKYELFKRTCSMYKMQFAASILIQYYVESGFWSVDMDRQDTACDLFSCSSTCCRLQCTGRWHCSLLQTGPRSDKQRSGPLIMVTSNHFKWISRSYLPLLPDRWQVSGWNCISAWRVMSREQCIWSGINTSHRFKTHFPLFATLFSATF